MEKIRLLIFIILIAMSLILYYKGFGKIRRILNAQCALYEDGITMGRTYQTARELYEEFPKGKYRVSMGEEGKIIIHGQLTKHTFYLEDGKVKYIYPKIHLPFSRALITTQQLRLARKIKIIVEANQIMDELKETDGIDLKNKYSDALAGASAGQKINF